MAEASEILQVTPHLFLWSAYDPSVKCELYSTALVLNGNLVVIDPSPVAPAAWQDLAEIAPLRAVLLTNGNHVRHAEFFRKMHRVPIATSITTRKDITELKPDVILLPNELLYGISAWAIPGATPGETAFLAPNGILVLGDAVLNVSPEKGLELLPDKYCTDAAQNRASLHDLLKLDFTILAFAHGLPVVNQAKEKLRALLTA